MTRTHSIINRLAHSKMYREPKRSLPTSLTQFVHRKRNSVVQEWQKTPLGRKTNVILSPKQRQSEPRLDIQKNKTLQNEMNEKILKAVVEAMTGNVPTNNASSGIANFNPVMGKMNRRRKKKMKDGGDVDGNKN